MKYKVGQVRVKNNHPQTLMEIEFRSEKAYPFKLLWINTIKLVLSHRMVKVENGYSRLIDLADMTFPDDEIEYLTSEEVDIDE